MKNQTSSQRVLKWLRGNEIPLGGLTSHDTAALFAATEIANVWCRADSRNRKNSAVAFACIVGQMQPTTAFMAFHAIAMVADWSHRAELWKEAELDIELVQGKPNCSWGPGRRQPAMAAVAAKEAQ
jgi:hypothetical protein